MNRRLRLHSATNPVSEAIFFRVWRDMDGSPKRRWLPDDPISNAGPVDRSHGGRFTRWAAGGVLVRQLVGPSLVGGSRLGWAVLAGAVVSDPPPPPHRLCSSGSTSSTPASPRPSTSTRRGSHRPILPPPLGRRSLRGAAPKGCPSRWHSESAQAQRRPIQPLGRRAVHASRFVHAPLLTCSLPERARVIHSAG